MAIEAVASFAHAGNPTTAPAGTLPATQKDDILVVAVTDGNTNTGPGSLGGTSVSSGGLTWTKLAGAAGSGATMHGSLWWTRATGNHSGQTVTATTNNSGALAGAVFRGCVTAGDPFDVSSAAGHAAAVVTRSGLTSTVDGCMLILALCEDDDVAMAGQESATVGSMVEQVEAGSTGGNDTLASIATVVQPYKGETGNFNWTGGTSDFKVSIAAALKPASYTPPALTPRRFNGVDNRIALDDGGVVATGAISVAVLLRRRGEEGASGTPLCLSGAEFRELGLQLGDSTAGIVYAHDDGDVASGLRVQPSDGWCVVGFTHPGGAGKTVRFHRVILGGAATHQNGGTANGPNAITAIDLGAYRFGSFVEHFNGDMFVAGVWGSVLSDADFEALADDVAAWLTRSPAGAVVLDQKSVAEEVEDEMGKGADQTARVGTTILAEEAPIPLGELPEIPEWELSLDSELEGGDFAKAVLGVLNGELYLFGSSNESAGEMAGVHRFRAGAWEELYAGSGEDFNLLATYGAVPYKGKLYVGDRRRGRLYRLDLDASGGFQALTNIGGEGFVGGEDVFPAAVHWERLYLGTYGNSFSEDLGYEPPGVYRYDGSTVTQILKLEDIDVAGEVSSMVFYEGKIWISAQNFDRDLCEIWTIEENDTTTLISSGETIMRLSVWEGELVAATYEESVEGSPAESEFLKWTGAEFEALAGPWSVTSASEWVAPIREQLWGSDYYQGLTAWNGSSAQNIGLGSSVIDPNDASAFSEEYGGVISVRIHRGYVWVATSQPCKVWRLKLPALDLGPRPGSLSLLGVGR